MSRKKSKQKKSTTPKAESDEASATKTQKKEEPTILLADDDSSQDELEEINDNQSITTEEGRSDEVNPQEEEEKTNKEEDDDDNDDDASDDDAEDATDEEGEETKETNNTPAIEPAFKSDGRYHNKQRCLILCSRGVTSRFRHLLEDLRTLIPHHKKDSKLDVSKNATGGLGAAVNDIAEMRGCNSVLFLECRKRQDAYLWIGRTGAGSGKRSGPSAKFLMENIHTMDELRLTGNCMRGSRPILTFDKNFDGRQELKLLKCLFTDVFGSPRGHPKSKPFVDRVMGFYYADGKIWVRNYQIVEQHANNAKEAHTEKKLHGNTYTTNLVEIGPRFVLNPIRIFRGSFGGQTIFQNDNYMSPNATRSNILKDKGRMYEQRKDAQKKRKLRDEFLVLPANPLDSVFR